MNEEWGPWIEHDGKGCQIVDRYAQWELDGGHEYVGVTDVNGWKMVSPGVVQGTAKDGRSWKRSDEWICVIRYRVRKLRGLTILENLVASLDAPEGPAKLPGKVKA